MGGLKQPLLAACILALMAGTARADDKEKTIDCGETDLKIESSGYTSKCYDLSDATLNVDTTFAARKTYELFAVSDADLTLIDVIDNRDLGNIYLLRRGLDTDIGSYFNVAVANWKATSGASGFEAAEFDGGPKNRQPLQCVAFRRPVTLRGPGYGRVVVGVACAAGNRKQAYDAIAHLQAPGR
ncbi:MAG TPA: hypothetical protein VMT54_05260 [Candidatus Cybelea sp.]|nr:hypothetical protein [Candidatus Cybelea sp.]